MGEKVGEIRPRGFRDMRANRQTDRHTHHNTSHPRGGGKVINYRNAYRNDRDYRITNVESPTRRVELAGSVWFRASDFDTDRSVGQSVGLSDLFGRQTVAGESDNFRARRRQTRRNDDNRRRRRVGGQNSIAI